MAATSAQQHHRSTLKQYLQSHSKNDNATIKQGSKDSSRGLGQRSKSQLSSLSSSSTASSYDTRSNSTTKTSNVTRKTNRCVKLPYIRNAKGGKPTAESLPDELLSLIFWKLDVGDLINASQVCRRWHRVAKDNLLWKHYYSKFVGPTHKEEEDKVAVNELDPGCWKNLCLKRCKVKRDQIYLKKWKQPDSYTGLKQRPELTLGKVGVRFELTFIDASGHSQIMSHSDIYWITMSASVRWYDLVFPEVKDIYRIQVHACSPLMFYGPSKPAKDGIVQKSLLVEYKGNLKEAFQKLKVLGTDAQIELFELAPGLIIARYQADGEIAFVTSCLHYHNLISRCLCGSHRKLWLPPKHQHTEDDIDPQYGLHGYSCIMQIRNMRQKLLEMKFINLDTSKDKLGHGFASFRPVRKEDKATHISIAKDIIFPWKTTLFKGIAKNVGILDLILLDESGEPFWTVSSGIQVEKSTQTDQFDFDKDAYRAIHYSDDVGRIHLEIGKLDDGWLYLSHAAIHVAVSAINAAFKTSY